MSVHDSMQKIANGTPVEVYRDGEWVDGVYIGLDWQMFPKVTPYTGHVVLTLVSGMSNWSVYDNEDVRVVTREHSPLDDYTTEELLAEVGRRVQ